MTQVHLIFGVILALLRAVTGAFALLFSSALALIAFIVLAALLVGALTGALGIGFSRRH